MSNQALLEKEEEKRKRLSICKDESGKCDDWNRKYIHPSLYMIGAGAYGIVFQVSTRLYSQGKQKIARDRYVYHPDFLRTCVNQRRIKPDHIEKIKDNTRDDNLLDVVALKYEILDQSNLEEAHTNFRLFLRREFLVMDTIWRRNPRQLVGFPIVFDFGYIGDKLQYGVNSKYKNTFNYFNIQGESVKFFADTNNRNLEGVTKISYMAMELLGPSLDDIKYFYEPWYAEAGVKSFFEAKTVFKIADQFLCRLLVLHRAGFVHHDLKPDNIAFGNKKAMNTVYLLDFGFAKQVSNIRPEYMGSRKYISIDAFNKCKPNYAQDIESFFYVVMSLLYDQLPWSDEMIEPIKGEITDDASMWETVIAMKKTWWGDQSDAQSLREFIGILEQVHRSAVPDIKQIIELLYKKVRDLRNLMRQMDDATTLNSELNNSQSAVFRAYMSVRKVLLHIFHLPKINSNQHLHDAEFQSYVEARTEKGREFFKFSSDNFEWEWDVSFSRMMSRFAPARGSGSSEFDPIAGSNADEDKRRAAAATAAALAFPQQKPDEISYIYDSDSNRLVPKSTGWRVNRLFLTQQQRGVSADRPDRSDKIVTLPAVNRLGNLLHNVQR